MLGGFYENKKIPILLIIVCIFVIIGLFNSGWLFDEPSAIGPLGHKVMQRIDYLLSTEEKCVIDMKEITDFEWDRLFVFNISCSLKTIRNLTGDQSFTEPSGNWSHLVFMKEDKIVYKESYKASVEQSFQFNIFFEYGGDYMEFKPEEAKIVGRRFINPDYSETDSNAPHYYSLIFDIQER